MKTFCHCAPSVAAWMVALFGCPPVHAGTGGHSHVHGVARLDVAVDARSITFHLDSPLDNLLGFEHAPRSDGERRQADAVTRWLRSASGLFRIDPAGQCAPVRVDLASKALGLGPPSAEGGDEGHADLDADYGFDCVTPSKARYIDVDLFAFARLQAVEVQVALPQRAFRRGLQRPARRLSLLP